MFYNVLSYLSFKLIPPISSDKHIIIMLLLILGYFIIYKYRKSQSL